MVRRYESADGSEHDDYAHYQPRRSGYGVTRYEVGRQSLQSLQTSVRAKRLYVYTNGEKPQKTDKFSNTDKYRIPPVQIAFSKKKFPQLTPLFEEIRRRTDRKVLRLFKWPSGREVVNVSEIEEEEESNLYVCSNEKALIHTIPYARIEHGGSPFTEKYSRTSHDSRGTLRSEKTSPKAIRSHQSMNGSKVPPVKIEVTSNTHRDKSCSIIVDTRSHQEFEKIFETIEDMIDVETPITALYSKIKPFKKVDSYSSLNNVLRNYGKTFWACGAEGPPFETKSGSRDTSPMRNGHQQKQKYGKRQQDYEDRQRQVNGQARQQPAEQYEDAYGRSYQRHQDQYDDDVEQDETDLELSPKPTARGGRRNDQSPRRDSKPASNRSSQRRDEDDENGRYGNKRGSYQADQNRQRRQQTPPPKKEDNKRGKRDEEESDEDANDDREREHPSEEEMAERIEEMERPDSKLDRRVNY